MKVVVAYSMYYLKICLNGLVEITKLPNIVDTLWQVLGPINFQNERHISENFAC